MKYRGLLVPELLSCPRCNERNMDDLIFEDETSHVRCRSCDHQYNADRAFMERFLSES